MNNFKKNIYIIWGSLDKKRKKLAYILLLIMTLCAIAEVVSIGAVLPLIKILLMSDNSTPTSFGKSYLTILADVNEKYVITMAFITAAVVSSILKITQLYIQANFSHQAGVDIASFLNKKILTLPYSAISEINSAKIISAITNKVSAIVYSIILPTLTILSSIILCILLLISLFLINPQIAIISIFTLGFMYIFIMINVKSRLAKISDNINKLEELNVKQLQETLGGIRDVILDNSQAYHHRKFTELNLKLRTAQSHSQILGGFPRSIFESLGIIMIALIAYNYSDSSNKSEIIGTLAVLALAAQKLLPIMQQSYSAWVSIRSNLDILSNIKEFISINYNNDLNVNLNSGEMNFMEKIIFIEASFSHPNSTDKILDKQSFEINKGEIIGVVGTTGSGKSTLIDLIMGLQKLSEGKIQIDSTTLNEKNSSLWMKKIAHVPQDIYLIDGAIRANITLSEFNSNKNVNPNKEIHDCCKNSEILSTILDLPEQFETVVGERGIRLSGGQKQRIGIARALFKKSELIVLDEATSALDSNTEDKIMNNIINHKKNNTIIIVAHRVNTLKFCNYILELKNGNLYKHNTKEYIAQQNR